MCISVILTKHKLFALANCQISVSQNMNSDQKENGHLTIPYLLHPGEHHVHDILLSIAVVAILTQKSQFLERKKSQASK